MNKITMKYFDKANELGWRVEEFDNGRYELSRGSDANYFSIFIAPCKEGRYIVDELEKHLHWDDTTFQDMLEDCESHEVLKRECLNLLNGRLETIRLYNELSKLLYGGVICQ